MDNLHDVDLPNRGSNSNLRSQSNNIQNIEENLHNLQQNIQQNNNQIDESLLSSLNLSPLSSTIEEIHRATNDEILNLFRRVVMLRERSNNTNRHRNDLLFLEEGFYEFLVSNKVFLFSPFLLILLISFLGLQISNIVEKNDISQTTIKLLEQQIMWIPYIFSFLICVVIIWNVYLLIFKIVTNMFEKLSLNVRMKNLFECSTVDILYFNPLYFNMLIVHYDKKYMSTNFDLFAIMLISTHFMINFFFSTFIYNFYKLKITNITNLYLNENNKLIYKFRFLMCFLISMNLYTSYLMSFLTTEADFYFIYLMQHKCVYLVLKQIHMWYENETSFKQLDNFYSTNEQYYLNTIFVKMVLQLVAMVLILQILFFGNGLFCRRGAYIFFVPCSIICAKTIYEFFKVFRNYEEIKTFFDKLDVV